MGGWEWRRGNKVHGNVSCPFPSRSESCKTLLTRYSWCLHSRMLGTLSEHRNCCIIWYLVTNCGRHGALQRKMWLTQATQGESLSLILNGEGCIQGLKDWEFSLGSQKSVHLTHGSCPIRRTETTSRLSKQDVTLNHYFRKQLQIRHWKHMLHLQTKELSLLNDITAGEEEFSSGGQKCPS